MCDEAVCRCNVCSAVCYNHVSVFEGSGKRELKKRMPPDCAAALRCDGLIFRRELRGEKANVLLRYTAEIFMFLCHSRHKLWYLPFQ